MLGMVQFRNQADRASAALLCCFRFASKLRIDPRTAKTSQRQWGESGVAAVQLMWCRPTSWAKQVFLIVINRITDRDDAPVPMHAAFDPRQGDRVLPEHQLETLSSRTPLTEQLRLPHCPHQFGSNTQPCGVHNQLDWERMVLRGCMQSNLIALLGCSLCRCHLNG